YFDDWESTTDVFFVSEKGLLYRIQRAAPSTAIPVPRERIRAALDAKRAAEKKATYGPPPPEVKQAQREAQEDHFRDAAEMVEGPWRICRGDGYSVTRSTYREGVACYFPKNGQSAHQALCRAEAHR